MYRIATLAALLILIYTGACAQQKNPVYSKAIEEKIKQVENNLGAWVKIVDSPGINLQKEMAFYKVHGVSVAVINNYQLEWARGYGFADTADKRTVTTETLFQAASISKSLNAMGVLKLVDQKKIDLQQNINTWLTSWKFPEDSFTSSKKITVANLLSHTAGLSVHGFPGYNWKDSLPNDNQILDGQRPANTKAVRSMFAPGTRFQYSGGGTTVSKKIIIDVTNNTYDNFIHHQVLEPLGMVRSFYSQPPPPGAFRYLSTAYHRDGKPVSGKFHIYPEQAADGLWTNPSDLARFIIEMQLSRQGKSNKVLSKAMTDTMLTPFIDRSAALGVFIDERGGQKYFQHGGANEGFQCQYYGSFEKGNGVIVMVNSDNGAVIPELINSVATVYQWKDFYKPQVRKTVAVPADTLKTYVGEYWLNTIKLTVVQKDKSLYLHEPNDSEGSQLYFTDNKSCFLTTVDAKLEFQKDGMMIFQNGGQFKAVRK